VAVANDGLRVERVVSPKRAEIAAAQLRGQIIRGELKEGDPLPPEGELMAMFGISRPTVREALRVLESESLIWVRRGGGGGARVRAPHISVAAGYAGALLQYNGATVDDVFDARYALEPSAIRMLALQKPADGLELVRDALKAEEEAGTDTRLFRPCAIATHMAIIHATGNQTLSMFFDLTVEIIDRHARLTYEVTSSEEQLEKNFRVAHRLHNQVFEHIVAGKEVEAVELWRRHLGRNRKVMLSDDSSPVLDLFRD